MSNDKLSNNKASNDWKIRNRASNKKCWLSYLLPEEADVDDDDADEDSGETFLHGGVAVDHGDNVQKKKSNLQVRPHYNLS